MSTRSAIFIYGKQDDGQTQCVRLYRHSDGYPSSNLATIAAAINKAGAPNPTQIAVNLMLDRPYGPPSIRLDAAGELVMRPMEGDLAPRVEAILSFNEKADQRLAWVAGWVDGMEKSIKVAIDASEDPNGTADPWKTPNPDAMADFPIGANLNIPILGRQGDLEWVYFIDANTKNVNVYGSGLGLPSQQVAKGPTDPMRQVDGVMADYAASEAESVMQALSAFAKTGWTLNQATLGIEKECEADARKWDELESLQDHLPRGMRLTWPDELANEKLKGPMIKVGESFALQRVLLDGGYAYVAHDRADLEPSSLSEGMRYAIAYPASGKGVAKPASAEHRLAQ